MSKEASLNKGKARPKQTLTEEEKGTIQPTNKPKNESRGNEENKQLSQKQKLIDQNIKLKTQIYDLSKQLDDIMGKEQSRKKKYGIKQDDDQSTKEKKIQLKKQQLEVMSLKNKIYGIKRQLQTVYNNRALVAKEDQLKYLRNELQTLEEEKKGLLKIKHEQTKVLKIAKNEQQYEDKIDELKKELHGLKQQSKNLNEKLIQSERVLRKNHEQYILKQAKVKQLEQKLLNSQMKSKKKKPIQSVSPEMIQQLEEQITRLEQERKQTEKTWYDKINAIDLELREKKLEEEKKLMLLKEKQKELKLNELKIKELRKLIKHNMTENSERVSQDMDLHQYRYKRNIKYL